MTGNAAAQSRGYLGVQFAALAPNATRVQDGVLINQVLPGSAAQQAGLKPGQIVTQIDGEFVADPKSAVDMIANHHAGDKLTLTVIDLSNGFNQRRILITLAANAPNGFVESEKPTSAQQPRGPGPMTDTPEPKAPAMPNETPPRGSAQALGNPTPLQPVRSGYCTAMAPPNWQVTDINKENSAFTVASPGANMRASWGIVAVNSGQAAGYYGPQFRTPAAFTQFLTGYLFGSQADAIPGPQMPYGFQSLAWRTPNGFSGYAVFRVFPLAADPRGYIVSYRIGGAPTSEASLFVPLAVSVAASIRCNTQLRPPPPNDFHPAKGARCFGSECSEADAASRSFNSILGTEYVHDAAGNNFYVGSENWIENGKDGPGYYKKNGNDVTKLQPGLQ